METFKMIPDRTICVNTHTQPGGGTTNSSCGKDDDRDQREILFSVLS